jgi:hypothetical protein
MTLRSGKKHKAMLHGAAQSCRFMNNQPFFVSKHGSPDKRMLLIGAKCQFESFYLVQFKRIAQFFGAVPHNKTNVSKATFCFI